MTCSREKRAGVLVQLAVNSFFKPVSYLKLLNAGKRESLAASSPPAPPTLPWPSRHSGKGRKPLVGMEASGNKVLTEVACLQPFFRAKS